MMVLWFDVRWWKMALVVAATALACWATRSWLLPGFGVQLPGLENGLPCAGLVPFTVAASSTASSRDGAWDA
jgi:hypothetical protein